MPRLSALLGVAPALGGSAQLRAPSGLEPELVLGDLGGPVLTAATSRSISLSASSRGDFAVRSSSAELA